MNWRRFVTWLHSLLWQLWGPLPQGDDDSARITLLGAGGEMTMVEGDGHKT
jgi:hypothetical protein